ncbi:14-3-3 protein 7 [Tanacetum coccineum]
MRRSRRLRIDLRLCETAKKKGVVRFGKKGKLAPRFVGPFEIIEKVGAVANRLDLPEELNGVHDTFHVSNLKKCLADPTLQVPLDEIRVDAKFNFVEELVEILEREFKKLKWSRISIVKVRWNSKRRPEFTSCSDVVAFACVILSLLLEVLVRYSVWFFALNIAPAGSAGVTVVVVVFVVVDFFEDIEIVVDGVVVVEDNIAWRDLTNDEFGACDVLRSCLFTSMADIQARHRFRFFSRVSRVTSDIEGVPTAFSYMQYVGSNQLTAEERKVLFFGYEEVIGAKLEKWRKVSKIKNSGDMHFVSLAKEYLKRVESEITEKCHEILATVDYLLSRSKTKKAAVFYHKMKGDYYSYLAEVKRHADREEATSQSLKAYEAATAIAESHLTPTNPIRLGLALNFSAFLYEIMANTERARNMAIQASKDAAAELDSLDQKSHQECSLIMQLIEDNLTLWTPDPAEDEVVRPPPPSEWVIEVDSDSRHRIRLSGENLKDLNIKAGDRK